jgi:hypothetical protein
MNVVFLDFDGVTNIPFWSRNKKGKLRSKFNWPKDGTVNSYQAVQWVSEFCERYNYSIVVSSTWRRYCDYRKCLYKSDLRKDIQVLGHTPLLEGKKRGDEITQYLKEHPEIDNYLIFDDDSDMTIHMDRLVKCDCLVGFTLREFTKARILHERFTMVGKRRTLMRIKLGSHMELIPSIDKKIINGKERYDFCIQLLNYKTKKLHFIQADSNIWWKPKKLIKDWPESHGTSVGWLFVQMGYLNFNGPRGK